MLLLLFYSEELRARELRVCLHTASGGGAWGLVRQMTSDDFITYNSVMIMFSDFPTWYTLGVEILLLVHYVF